METPEQQFAFGRTEHLVDGQCIAPLFKLLATEQRTGILTVRSDSTARTVAFRDGSPVFATSNEREERFVSVLIRLGIVRLSDLLKGVERMLKESCRLGEILIREGLLDKSGVMKALQLQVVQIICNTLATRKGQLSFNDQPVPPHADVGFQRPVNSLIREALFSVNAFHWIMDEIGGTSAIYSRSERFEAEVDSADFTLDQTAMLPLFEEPGNLQQYCAESTLKDFDVCRLVWVLLVIGALIRIE